MWTSIISFKSLSLLPKISLQSSQISFDQNKVVESRKRKRKKYSSLAGKTVSVQKFKKLEIFFQSSRKINICFWKRSFRPFLKPILQAFANVTNRRGDYNLVATIISYRPYGDGVRCVFNNIVKRDRCPFKPARTARSLRQESRTTHGNPFLAAAHLQVVVCSPWSFQKILVWW